jgi:hypothetical protein
MDYHFPRCQIIPLPDDQVSFQIDGVERTRWHFGGHYPRPFFYPLVGPSGTSLTRMGHPGAANHDHHRSVWFAHAKVLGIDFWSDNTAARIRQQHWLCYEDGDDEAAMAVSIGWYDAHDPAELVEQQLVAIVRPGEGGETFLEVQSTFRPRAEMLELGQTNFGFFAVRVAKNISAYFGGGKITSSEGGKSEPEIFGKPARWMDYSGPVPAASQDPPQSVTEGVTYFDHPSNPTYPSRWHVREDGWMGASICREKPILLQRESPLVVRYLLHAHAGELNAGRADQIAGQFSNRPGYEVVRSDKKHRQYEIKHC